MASTGRNRPHRRRLELWAPNETIEAAEAEAAATEEQRSKHREHSARSRAKQEAAYRDEFEDVIRRWSSPPLAGHADAISTAMRWSAEGPATVAIVFPPAIMCPGVLVQGLFDEDFLSVETTCQVTDCGGPV